MAAWSGLVQRDLRLLLRSRSQLYSSLLTPLLLLAVRGTGVSEGLSPTGVRDGDYTSFLVSGIIVMTALFSSTFASGSYYRDRDSGMLRSFFLSPHSPRSIIFGKALGSVLIGTVQAALVLALALAWPAIDVRHQYGWLGSLLLAGGVIVLLNVLLGGLAQLLAAAISTMQGFHLVMNLLLFPLLFLSGAFYPLANLPPWLEWLARLDPLTYAVEPLQLALYADGREGYLGVGVSLPILTVLALAVFALGIRRIPQTI